MNLYKINKLYNREKIYSYALPLAPQPIQKHTRLALNISSCEQISIYRFVIRTDMQLYIIYSKYLLTIVYSSRDTYRVCN